MAIAIGGDGLGVEEEKPLPVWFRGFQIVKFRADLVVASAVIVEVKTRPEIDPFNKAQVLHYLKATDLEVGLLLNFGRRPEFHRVVCEQSRKGPRFPSPLERQDAQAHSSIRGRLGIFVTRDPPSASVIREIRVP